MVRNLAVLVISMAAAACAMAQPSPSGVLYATDFNNWSLPQGNSPTNGLISYPTQDLCRVSSNGYSFTAPKAGRPLMIQDANPALTETFTPSAVFVGPSGCTISGVMAHTHISYTVRSATYGAQEALDYQASYSQGAVVVLTPAWTAAGGTTGVLGTLKGATSLSLLDQRTATITPYNWNGSQYVAQPFGSGSINPGSSYQLPVYPSGSAASVGPSNITTDATGNNLNTPGSVTAGSITTPGVAQGQLRDNGGEKFNLLAFGAVSDAKLSKVCSMTAGSAVLTCDDAPFVAGAVGMPISVQYAGVSEAGPINGNLITTIAGYTDASHVTLAATASNTTRSGMIDIDGVSLIGGAGNQDLGPGTVTNQGSATISGTIGQTCLMNTFNNGGGTATATIPLTAANSILNAAYLVTAGGGGLVTSAPTSATLANGTATCSGTVTVSSTIDVGFGYYSGQWPTTTSGAGTGATISIYGNLMGGGVNQNYYPPHYIVNQGTGYAVNDTLCPTVTGADGKGCFKVNAINKSAAIWGTDNFTAFSNWLAACNGTKNCFIPAGNFLVTSASNSHKISFISNTSVTQDPAGAIYTIGTQPGYCVAGGWGVFRTADGTRAAPTNNVHIKGLHLEGELQTPGQYAFGCGPAAFWIGNYNNNVEIEGSTFRHLPGTAITAFSAGGTGIKIHHNYCDQTGDSCFNINTEGLEIHNNTFVNTPGMELGGGPGTIVAHNFDYNGNGLSQIGMGGATSGEPYYGGLINANQIINPLRTGINIASAFAKGSISNNLVTGMTGWFGQGFCINQAGGTVPSFANTYTGNVCEAAGGGNGGSDYGILVSSNAPLGQPPIVLQSNVVRGGFGTGASISGTTPVIGIGNYWSSVGTCCTAVDLGIAFGSPTYIGYGDTLATGTYSYLNTNGTILGTFINGATNTPFSLNTGGNSSPGNNSTLGQLNWLTLSGMLQGYGLASIQIPALSAPGTGVVGTTGATTYTYYCTAVGGNSIETSAGTTASVTTGNATLSTTNYNTVTCPYTLGAVTMSVYRTVGGAAQGRIATGLTNNARILNDTGLSGSGSFAPATNLTGGIKLGGTYYAPATICKSDGTNCPSTPVLVASGTTALATSAIASATCQTVTAGSVNSSTATGALSTDKVAYNTSGSISAVTGYAPSTSGGLQFNPYLTSGFINFDVCNWSAGSITPGAVTVNWEVLR